MGYQEGIMAIAYIVLYFRQTHSATHLLRRQIFGLISISKWNTFVRMPIHVSQHSSVFTSYGSDIIQLMRTS